MYVEVSIQLPLPKKEPQNLGEKVSAKFISSRDGPVKKHRNKAQMKQTRRLPHYGMMAEKEDKKTILHLLYMQHE